MRKVIYIIPLVVLLATLGWAGRLEAAGFSVEVRNGTRGTAVADYPVTVWVRPPEGQGGTRVPIGDRTDAAGRFRGEMSWAPGSVLSAEVHYRGATYRSAPVVIGDETKNYQMRVTVYEITSSRAGVHILSRRMVLAPKDGRTLEVDELLRVANSGDKTYVGTFDNQLDMREVLPIAMPTNSILLAFTSSGTSEVSQGGQALVSRSPLPPGTTTITLRYAVRSDTGRYDLTLVRGENAPPTDEFSLLVPRNRFTREGGWMTSLLRGIGLASLAYGRPVWSGAAHSWTIDPATLGRAGTATVDGVVYRMLRGRPGITLRLAAYGPSYKGGFGLWQLWLFAALLLPALTLFLLGRRLRRHHRRQEYLRLVQLLGMVDDQTGSQSQRQYYQPLLRVLEDRLTKLCSRPQSRG